MTKSRDEATEVECWRTEAGYYLRLPGEQRAGKPYPTFDACAKAAMEKVICPFAWTFRDPARVPKEHYPITRSRDHSE